MSAEALRAFTRERVENEIHQEVEGLIDASEAPLDRLRYVQGFINGLRHALRLQDEAYKKVGM